MDSKERLNFAEAATVNNQNNPQMQMLAAAKKRTKTPLPAKKLRLGVRPMMSKPQRGISGQQVGVPRRRVDGNNANTRYHALPDVSRPKILRRPFKSATSIGYLSYATISRNNTADEHLRKSASFAYLGSKLATCNETSLKSRSSTPQHSFHSLRQQDEASSLLMETSFVFQPLGLPSGSNNINYLHSSDDDIDKGMLGRLNRRTKLNSIMNHLADFNKLNR
ncbi:hypothetical protein F4679DRAFT_535523 [Xylaria curta]|nr:hypothetical protein F4679DRAFT_535523 [Xylaria curta]